MSPHKKGTAAMIDRWANLDQLHADGRRVLRWIKRQGVVMCCDSTEQERAKEFLLPVFRVLEDTIRVLPLCAVYLYRQSDQPPTLRTTSGILIQDADGITWIDATPDRGRLYAVGLSAEALDRGREYFQFLFLHELAHVLCGGDHGAEFHKHLDMLIDRFNAATGSTVRNDYQGLQEGREKEWGK